MLRSVIISTWLFIFCAPCFAQSSQYQFSHLNISNGLSHNQVNSIYKDSRGFMWFGTLAGLNRYDGYKFKVFKYNSQDTSSLSDDYIVSICEGPENKIWIQTRNGYNIYDPLTEHFDRSPQTFLKSIGLPDAEITWIKKDNNGNFWFVYSGLGIYQYSPKLKQAKHFYSNGKNPGSLASNNITGIALNAKCNAWLVYQDGTIDLLDPESSHVIFRSQLLRNAISGKPVNYSITLDNDNDLWFYSSSTSMGIYYFDPQNNILKHVDKDEKGNKLRSNIIFNILQDNKGLIWIATDHGGITLIDKSNFNVTYLLNREDDSKSLGQNSVCALYKDNTDIIWAGTYKRGISYYHQNLIRFPVYRHHTSDPKSLPFDDVNRFVEDAAGNLWIGTNGGGLIYFNRKAGTYTRYVHNPANNNSLANDVIVSLCLDHEQKLWIGTYWGGLDCFDGKDFTHFRHSYSNPKSISDDRVWSIMEDSDNQLWVGTLGGGLNRYDRQAKEFSHYGPEQKNSISFAYISAIVEDWQKNIWIGGFGVNILEKKSGRITRYLHNDKNPNSLIHNNINSIKIDSRKLAWICTREGLSIFNSSTGTFINLRKENGLPDNTILDILEDNNHSMWLSTPNGLCNVTVNSTKKGYSFSFKNFDETDGLQGREFNMFASLKTRNGELIFAGANGFNLFKPANIHTNSNKINLVFTDLQVFNKSVSANELIENHIILTNSITETKQIELRYNENAFALEFAALNFFNSAKLIHQYMMQGFDKDWVSTDNNIRKATYTNLDPGDYIFKVRAVNPEMPGNIADMTLKIRILPPFWKTPFAYLLYIAAVFGLLFFVRLRGIQKLKAQFALDQERTETQRMREIERQDAQRMHELDLMKIKFLTNVSHEFRTPLSLIMAPADKILQNSESADQKQQVQIIKRNARRLLNLVNQLLDFRKLEVHELKLHTSPGDIVRFIKDIAASFTDIAESKKTGFVFDSEIEHLHTHFDHDKIERILFNLLSNAFKFTQPGGHISVLLSLVSKPGNSDDPLFEIKVMDTGIGIPAEKLEKVFDRFFQNDIPGSMLNQGSGIGLSIVKEFVKMHGGEITVESELNQGSCFIVQLPFDIAEQPEMNLSSADTDIVQPSIAENKKKKDVKKATVLLVEDNDDFRFYLKDNLKEVFNILEAANGKEGWQKALALHPDLMVSDINMPEMNGTELCKKIKNDSRTSHIPVILLTALSAETEQVKGLETGANDYMTKPFNFEILVSKLRNLLTLQDAFKRTYTKHVDVNLPEMAVQSQDEKFISNMLEYIEANILNPNLSVEELSKQMCMSRVSLYKKVLMLTGKSPVEFIRSFRLKKAAQLFEKTQLNIAEISYEVGFNTPNYFAKSFKAEFNMLPSEYIQQVRHRYAVEKEEA